MKKIYSLETWVLFLIFLIPFILQNTEIGEILSLIIFTLGIVWFFKLTVDLYKKLPGGHALNINKFMFHFFFPLTYFSIVIFILGGYSINSNNIDEYGGIGPFLIVLHLFSMYCLFIVFISPQNL